MHVDSNKSFPEHFLEKSVNLQKGSQPETALKLHIWSEYLFNAEVRHRLHLAAIFWMNHSNPTPCPHMLLEGKYKVRFKSEIIIFCKYEY